MNDRHHDINTTYETQIIREQSARLNATEDPNSAMLALFLEVNPNLRKSLTGSDSWDRNTVDSALTSFLKSVVLRQMGVNDLDGLIAAVKRCGTWR
jgi:hypothetical protein